jgi:hypothetical protein
MPCPVCGNAVHPIAGKCKHCKTDLVKLRARQAPASQAVLTAAFAPRVDATPPPFAQAPPAAPAAAPGAAAASEAPGPTLYELPPLPGMAATRSRWPLVVAAIAGVAIVVCVILLLTDNESSAAGGIKKKAAPAPDRMDTMPAPPAPRVDPDLTPSTPPGHGTDPWGPQGTAPDPTPPPSTDPFGLPPSTPPPSSHGNGAAPPPDQFFSKAFEVGCARLAQCPGMESIEQFCSLASVLPMGDEYAEKIRTGQCTYDEHAAQRCLAGLSTMQCLSGQSIDFDLDKLQDLYSQFSTQLGDCTAALQCR